MAILTIIEESETRLIWADDVMLIGTLRVGGPARIAIRAMTSHQVSGRNVQRVRIARHPVPGLGEAIGWMSVRLCDSGRSGPSAPVRLG
jgi:hypothetical protein